MGEVIDRNFQPGRNFHGQIRMIPTCGSADISDCKSMFTMPEGRDQLCVSDRKVTLFAFLDKLLADPYSPDELKWSPFQSVPSTRSLRAPAQRTLQREGLQSTPPSGPRGGPPGSDSPAAKSLTASRCSALAASPSSSGVTPDDTPRGVLYVKLQINPRQNCSLLVRHDAQTPRPPGVGNTTKYHH